MNPDIYLILDTLAVDPSASNAWNAIPFSWLVDWFLPVGSWLETLPTVLRPNAYYTGTLSHAITGVYEFETRSTGPNPAFPSFLPLGNGTGRHYQRYAFTGSPLNQLVKWRCDSISNPSQVAILRDILFPVGAKRNFLKGKFGQ